MDSSVIEYSDILLILASVDWQTNEVSPGTQSCLVADTPSVAASKAAFVYEKNNYDDVDDMREVYRLLPASEPLK